MPNTIADNLQRLVDAKADIASAITAKGGTVNTGDGFEEFTADIATIPSGTEIANTIMLTGDSTFKKMLSGEDATSQYKNAAKTALVADGVTSISGGSGMFADGANLERISFPSSVASIAQYAFTNCRNLKTFVFPSNIVDIPQGCLSGCTSLEAVAIPNGVETIGSYAFGGTSALKTIAIPNSVTSIAVGAFAASGIESISLSHNMTTIPYNLFGGCTSLETIFIPSGVTIIDSTAFNGCTSLTKIIIDKANGSISGAPWGAPSTTQVVWTG